MRITERKRVLIDWIIHLEQERVLETLERLHTQFATTPPSLPPTVKPVSFRTSPLMGVELNVTRNLRTVDEYQGQIVIRDDFYEPLPEELWTGEIEP